MAVAMTDGPLGLESKLSWLPPAGASGIVLNDNWNSDGTIKKPRYKVDRIGNLRGLPDRDDNRVGHPGRMGEILLPAFNRGRTITVEGRIQGTTLQELRQMESALSGAFQNSSDEGVLAFVPRPEYGDDSAFWFLGARATDMAVDDEFLYPPRALPGPFQQKFTLGLRASDPRFYWSDDETVSGTSVTAVNSGHADAPLTITKAHAGGALTLTHTTTGRTLVWGSTLPAGSLVVDFATHRMTLDGDYADAVKGFVTADSDWWDYAAPQLLPGSNGITSSSGSITVAWRHATL